MRFWRSSYLVLPPLVAARFLVFTVITDYWFSKLPQLLREELKQPVKDFSVGLVAKNLSYNAKDMSSIPGWGTKILQTAEQLILWTGTEEFVH